MWQAVCIGSWILFLISGAVMWFFRGDVSPGIFQWFLVVHSVVFVVAFLMLMIHVYLGSIHPRMTESMSSMLNGKISPTYAKHHYGKWYDEITGGGGGHH
jgi:cytochrome b subunit of formate dehydrogenase